MASEKNWVRQTPEVEALAHTIKTKLGEDKARQDSFRDAMKRVVDSGVEKPDRAALAEAKSFASSPEELAQYESWYNQIHGRDTKIQAQRDQEFEQSLDALRKRLGKIHEDQNLTGEAKIEQMTQLNSDIQQLVRREDVSPAILSAGKTLQTAASVQLESLKQARTNLASRQSALNEVISSFGDPDALAARLKTFVEKYPDHELSVDFTKAKRLLPGWKLMPLWKAGLSTALGKASDPGDVSGLSREEREKMGATLAAALKEDEKGLFSPQLKEVWDYIDRSAKAIDPKLSPRAAQSELRKVMTYRPVAELGVLNVKKQQGEPRKFYVAKNYKIPKMVNKSYEVEYAANVYQALERQPLAKCDIADGELDLKQLKDKCAPDSPQRLFSLETISNLENSDFSSKRWATFHLESLARLSKADQMDPLLRVILARSLVSMARKQDWQDRPELEAWQKNLNADTVDTKANWLDPDDARVADARRDAQKVFDDARPDFESIIAEHDEWRKKITAWWLANSRRRPVAVLIRDPRLAKITTVIPAAEVAGGDATIEAIMETAEGWKLLAVGSANASGTNWNSMASVVPSGAILYLTPASPDATNGRPKN